MARIDVQTLVLAFERRISELEKNPPDKISTATIINMLEKAIADEIKDHFKELIYLDLREKLKKEFSKIKKSIVNRMITELFEDKSIREVIKSRVREKIVKSIS